MCFLTQSTRFYYSNPFWKYRIFIPFLENMIENDHEIYTERESKATKNTSEFTFLTLTTPATTREKVSELCKKGTLCKSAQPRSLFRTLIHRNACVMLHLLQTIYILFIYLSTICLKQKFVSLSLSLSLSL